MIWKNHSNLTGRHAKLSPSQSVRWATKDLNNDDVFKMINSGYSQEIGTLLHEYAEQCIRFSLKMTKYSKRDVLKHLLINRIPRNVANEYVERCFDNLLLYVNDAIGFRMDPEVILWYSDYIFGTADAIMFRDNKLQIHDLKTGLKPAHMEQLLTYAALFCLEYKIKPVDIDIELRIYQLEEVIVHKPETDEIVPIIDKIVTYNKWLTKDLD